MNKNKGWEREELLIAFGLYCKIPFGKFHSSNPEIVKYAKQIGRTPSALAMKLSNIASLDPKITSSGRKGLSSASAADRSMWEEMENDWERFFIESEAEMNKLIPSDNITESDNFEKNDYSSQDRDVHSKARIGQDFFRRAVLSAYSYKCCITGLAIPELLIASHIVPWSLDPKNRLNPKNGLLLSTLHDKAFDSGMITINEDMTLRLSSIKNPQGNQFFYAAFQIYANRPIALPEKFAPAQEFLKYHREQIFQG
jgi:putative restriction endonuclease